jgi:hypothetical protein
MHQGETMHRMLKLAVVLVALPLLLSTCKGAEPAPLVPTSIIVTPSGRVSLTAVGATQQFAAVVKDQNGNTMATAVVTWTTENAAVATVSATGLATAAGNGLTYINAGSGNVKQGVGITVAQVATQTAKVSGDLQTTYAGNPLPQPLVVSVIDANGHAIPGATVAFATTGGGSMGTPSAMTDASGQAQTIWTLGPTVGNQTASATVGTVAALSFGATATRRPANVALFSGGNLMGLAGYPVNWRPAVRVADASNVPVSGVALTFAVTGPGAGSVTGGVTTTDANGIAQVGSWTLGGVPMRQYLTATVTGVTGGVAGNPVTVVDTGAAAVFTIDIQYYGPVVPNAAEQAAFATATNKWQHIIYQHVGPPITFTKAANACGAGEPALTNQLVTDILIQAKFDSIDGPGKILGYASPCFIRSGVGLTLSGYMVFDTADVGGLIANGTLATVILHEMSHVLGLGTLWNYPPHSCLFLPSNPPTTIADTYFGCPSGRLAFDSMGGTTYTGGGSSPPAGNKVPVENCGTAPYVAPNCGAGTVNGHWRKVVLGPELMSGYLEPGAPLSLLTIAAQEDLGYTVNYSSADPFNRIFTVRAAGGGASRSSINMGDDIGHGPFYEVDPAGTVVRVIQRQ